MRNVNPGDLEELAKLIDGKDGLSGKLSEAFTRASNLNVSGELAALRPLTSWVSDTAPDLRKRAAIARLEDGDPEAGLLAAGFTPEDLKNYNGTVAPGTLLLASSVAQSDDPNADEFDRKPGESLADYIARLEAHAMSKIPGLEPHEETLTTLIKLGGDVMTFTTVAGVTAFQGSSFVKTVGGNSFKQGWGATLKNNIAAKLKSGSYQKLVKAGESLEKWTPKIRSLAAPGSWLPGQMGTWAAGRSPAYAQLTRVPLTGGVIGDGWGNTFDAARRQGAMNATWRGMNANRAINMLVGSDDLAKLYGGATHSGQPVARAGQANLINVFRKAKNSERFVQALNLSPNTGSPWRFGLKTAAKTAGGLRTFGIVGQGAMTAYSFANVVSQDPRDKFDSREEGAGYVADVAELGFNASLTAAMVAPNPVTIGATLVTGAIYGGAKVVQHWDDIKGGASKAAGWVGNKAKDLKDGAVNKAKDLGKKVNPKNWF
ncbi:PE-PGRS family protein [Streptomyces sp. 796.1]|uniref:PE-PGRS family protein n=1 Tax=Streptomyces sp. 796.1 TaxID=3163029 RepID=UPI0039C9D890